MIKIGNHFADIVRGKIIRLVSDHVLPTKMKQLQRRNISTGTPSEKRVGYSRAVVVGSERLYVSGTTSVDEKGKVHGKSLYEQTIYIFSKLRNVLKKAGFSKHDVVMVRAYVVDMKQLSEFDAAFKEEFLDVHPCCTLVGVSELVSKELLIEIEYVVEKVN